MKGKKKGQLNPVYMIYFAVMLVVGLVIFNQVDTTNKTLISSTTSAAYAAASNVTSNTAGGFQTLSVSPTVIAAVIVLGIVGMLAVRR